MFDVLLFQLIRCFSVYMYIVSFDFPKATESPWIQNKTIDLGALRISWAHELCSACLTQFFQLTLGGEKRKISYILYWQFQSSVDNCIINTHQKKLFSAAILSMLNRIHFYRQVSIYEKTATPSIFWKFKSWENYLLKEIAFSSEVKVIKLNVRVWWKPKVFQKETSRQKRLIW